MTLEEARTQARELARVDTTGISDVRLNEILQNCIREFANDVGGFAREKYPVVSASFDTDTHYAIRVTITGGTNALSATDVALTTTARSGTTGATVASDFQSTLRTAIGGGANATVTYDDFAFTVDTVDGTEITFAAPSDANYADARDILGLTGTTTESGADVTGSFPQGCTREYTLPVDLISLDYVAWNDQELWQVPYEYITNPNGYGVPGWFYVRGRTIYFLPSPNTQGRCKIWYHGAPDDIDFAGYQECGLSSISDELSTGLSTSTQYYYKVTINGEQTEYNITTASDVTYAAVIILMNAQNSGATFSIVGGDLRCTSDAVTGVSTIALAAGTSGTDLFGTLTGFSAFDTAVAGDTAVPTEIPAMYHKAIPFLMAYYLLLTQFDDKMAGSRYAEYRKTMQQYRLHKHLENTKPDLNMGDNSRPWYTVTA